MSNYKVISESVKLIGDLETPVRSYLKVRDRYPNSFLLESSDYRAREGSFSYLGFDPIASFRADENNISISYPDGQTQGIPTEGSDLLAELKQFVATFQSDSSNDKYIQNGLFGFTAYEAIEHFENIQLDHDKKADYDVPLMHYVFFRYVIAFDHFNSRIFVTENTVEGLDQDSGLDEAVKLIRQDKTPLTKTFTSDKDIQSPFTDGEYKEIVEHAIDHCKKGDTFQMVLSREFSTKFEGDDFQAYRALRSINPSPYLFYFDYGDFKIFGSSPEAQLVVKENKASIFPIAGTYRRTGDDLKDYELAVKLSNDIKETSEHVMLVDLARNDLSKSGEQVEVESFKEVQYFSHVIHLVSKVSAQLNKGILDVAADTFPAGTLSGAPKHRAMQLIDKYEKTKRGYYGGMIGFMDFSGNFNHAIIIRSFLSQNDTLFFQAGAGVVAKSVPDSEVQEVYNKVGALLKALESAEAIVV
ncbi:MAG: anthranilate synthase component I family protein [Cyclobacteriaceae bacterium]